MPNYRYFNKSYTGDSEMETRRSKCLRPSIRAPTLARRNKPRGGDMAPASAARPAWDKPVSGGPVRAGRQRAIAALVPTGSSAGGWPAAAGAGRGLPVVMCQGATLTRSGNRIRRAL